MNDRFYRITRRKFLASAAALTVGAGGLDAVYSPSRPRRLSVEGRKPVAVLATVYRPLSYACHLADRFLHGYTRQGEFHVPRHHVRSLYVDQRPDNDLSRQVAREFDVRLARSVADALTENGRLAVEGVLIVGEHGNYPRNDKGQVLYPRYEFLRQVVEVFDQTGQSCPVFNAKHLSYSWARATEMAGWARQHPFALMAGSTLPVTWRRPELELKLDTPIEEALVVGYGPIEVYGFDALEALQGMLERRKGGEMGVQAVTCLTGKDVWKAGDAGRWSWDLLDAALSRSESVAPGDVRTNTGSASVGKMPSTPAVAFLVEYRDGTRGSVLLLNGHVQDFCFAARLAGESRPASCLFHQPPPPGARAFDALAANVEKFLETGRPPVPLERTLLTGGVLDFAMESHQRRGTRIETPELDLCYGAPGDSGFVRGGVTAAS